MISSIKSSILGKDKRSKEIGINTILNVLFKGLGVICSYLTIPLALVYLDKSAYGAWLTLSSITAWIAMMDIGLGNGLKNKLNEAVSMDDKKLAREYVSTTYLLFSCIIVGIFLIFLIANFFLNWNVILNINIPGRILTTVALAVFFSFCCRLILDLASTVMVALQKTAVKSFMEFLISFLTLVSIYVLTKTSSSSFKTFSLIVALVPVLALAVFNYVLYFNSAYKYLRPSFSYFKKAHIHSLLNIGTQFFVIQIAGLIIFSTDNILITQFFSPADVASFNIAYKYFSIMLFVFSTLLLPYWPAFTNAFTRNEIPWIKSAFKKLLLIWVAQVLGVIVLILISGFVYRVWLGKTMTLSLSLSYVLGLYVIISNWNNIFAVFINGVSKIRLQLYSAIFAGIINIPLSYILAKHTTLGVSAIVLANCISLLISAVWSPIQCYKIISGTAKGIWNK